MDKEKGYFDREVVLKSQRPLQKRLIGFVSRISLASGSETKLIG